MKFNCIGCGKPCKFDFVDVRPLNNTGPYNEEEWNYYEDEGEQICGDYLEKYMKVQHVPPLGCDSVTLVKVRAKIVEIETERWR